MDHEDANRITKLHNVPVENLFDSKKECDPRKILENKNNFVFSEKKSHEVKIRDLLTKAPRKQPSTYDSDNSSVILDQKERKVFRKCKIFRRHNNEIEKNEIQRKAKEKMIIPSTVVEKIENNELDLGNMIEEANKYMEGISLVFDQNEKKRELTNDAMSQNRLLELKIILNEINNKFMEIEDSWEKTIAKEDVLVMRDDIFSLKKKSQDLLQQKDTIVNKLVDALEELLSKSLIEIDFNNTELLKLSEVAKSKLNVLKEEHKNQNVFMNKFIESETNKKNDYDSTKWKHLKDIIIDQITNVACKRLELIKENDLKFKEHYETNEEYTKNLRISMTKNNVEMDADLELVKIRFSDYFIKKLQNNCSILKKRVEENNTTLTIRKRHLFLTQENLFKMNEKYSKIESTYKAQISAIKKQIININKKINRQKKRAYDVSKRDNTLYIQIWDLSQNNIINCINNIFQIDYFIHEYLDINKVPIAYKNSIQPTINTLSLFNHIQNVVLQNIPSDPATNSYECIRDEALSKLLLDFIVRNSNFILDNELNEILDTNSMQNLLHICNALSSLNLNGENTVHFIKSRFKPFVMCKTCNSQIKWKLNADLEQKNKTNYSIEEIKSTKSLLDKLCTHITRHSKNIDNVKKSEMLLPNELNKTDSKQNDVLRNEKNEQNNKYLNVVPNDGMPSNSSQCTNAKHELYIDQKHFIPVMKEVVKETRSKGLIKPKSLSRRLQKESNFIQWQISENNLQTYWSHFTKYIQSKNDLWETLYDAVRRYHEVLVVRQKKLLKNKTLQCENEKLKRLERQLSNRI